MAAKTLVGLTNNCSKADEIAFVQAIADSIPGDAYLKNLFAAEMVDWAEFQIKSDFHPSLHEYFHGAEIENIQLNSKLTGAARQLKEANANHQAFVLENAKRLEQANDSVSYWRKQCEQRDCQIADAAEERDQLQADLDAANAVIIKLKAKLYDLMTK